LAGYLIKRLIDAIPVLLVVAIVVFGIVHLTPGDPARVMLGDLATEAEVTRLREALGLDRPIHVQFISWVANILRGDLGASIFLERPVTAAIAERAEPTLSLALLSLIFAVAIGVATGILSAVHHNAFGDQFFSIVALIGISIPNFWLGLILILFFAAGLGWFPAAGYVPISEGFWQHLRYLILPAFTLGSSQAALISRITRSAMLDVLKQDYIRTATAKGLPQHAIIYFHAFKNTLIPVLTVIGLAFAALLSGAVVVETVFAMPGLGRLIVSSIARRDYPIIQGVVLVVTVIYVLINLLVDLLYPLVDPRIKY
jgi:peptide/nickel transport system permease protein